MELNIPEIRNSPKVIAATVNWNRRELTAEWLGSILMQDNPPFEVLIVDSASSDGSFDWARKQSGIVKVLRRRENLGYGEGVNTALRYAFLQQADYLLVADNDTVLDPTCLSRLLNIAQANPGYGFFIPSLKDASDGIAIPSAIFDGLLEIGLDLPRPFLWPEANTISTEQDIDLAFSTVVLVNIKAAKEVGYLDPFYFMDFEDLDWFSRFAKKGWKGKFVPNAFARHKGSDLLPGGSLRRHYYWERNKLYFFSRNKKLSDRDFFWLFLSRILNFYEPRARMSLLALYDFMRGKRGSRDFNRPFRPWEKWVSPFCRLNGKLCRWIKLFIKKMTDQPLLIRVNIDWNIGDEIMASPVFEALREKYPEALINAQVRYPELLRENPFVAHLNVKGLKEDLLIDFHNEIRHLPRSEYLKKWARVQNWGIPKFYLKEGEDEEALLKFGLNDTRPLIAFCPEAGWLSRRWEDNKWKELAEYLERSFHATILLFGKDSQPMSFGCDLIGKTSLREAAALLSKCRLFVGSDSGNLYLALAVGIPAVGLFGPLNPALLFPARSGYRPIWSPVECRGCWPDGRMIYPDHCPKVVPDCMSMISLESVIKECDSLLHIS